MICWILKLGSFGVFYLWVEVELFCELGVDFVICFDLYFLHFSVPPDTRAYYTTVFAKVKFFRWFLVSEFLAVVVLMFILVFDTMRWILILFLVFVCIGCGKRDGDGAKSELVIFHAGSLSVPFRKLAEIFEDRYPDVKVLAEAAGSRHCARKVSELSRRCDVLASADYKVVENLLMGEYADFNICFATNEMAIAFTAKSRLAEKFHSDNWWEILLDDNVAVGRSDPDSDPCGYRALMVFQLAEKHYGVAGLAEKLAGKDKFIRPKETDLLVLLESGEIDYVMIYRSVALQHGLDILELPPEINLSSEKFAEFYSQAKVPVSGKRPGETIMRTGEAMVYSVTIPKTARNLPAAEAWIELLLSDEGRAVMEACGQKTINN